MTAAIPRPSTAHPIPPAMLPASVRRLIESNARRLADLDRALTALEDRLDRLEEARP